MKMILIIEKEHDKKCDEGSAYFLVKVTTKKVSGSNITIEGRARLIYNEMTFHLDTELDDLLNNIGIEPYEIVKALESGKTEIKVDIELPEPKMFEVVAHDKDSGTETIVSFLSEENAIMEVCKLSLQLLYGTFDNPTSLENIVCFGYDEGV